MNKDITAAYLAKQDTFGSVIEKADDIPWYHIISNKDGSQNNMLNYCETTVA